MKAAVLDAFGPGQPFRITDLPDPEPQPGTVLVRVHAAGVNPADVKIRANGGGLAPPLPALLGMDAAGEVVAVGDGNGDGVKNFAPGDRVYGCVGGLGELPGTLAEYVAADARLLAKMPTSLSYREAAALPLVSITAWEGLIDKAHLAAGQHVLVFGATGGVGHVAVQLAKAHGARVTAVVSSKQKADIAISLGADAVVMRGGNNFEQRLMDAADGEGYDIVFDTVGGDNLSLAMRCARLYGQVISLVTRQSYDLSDAMMKALSIHVVFMLVPMIHDVRRETHGIILNRIADLVTRKQLRPLLDERRFELATATDAFDSLVAGDAIGKLVIEIR